MPHSATLYIADFRQKWLNDVAAPLRPAATPETTALAPAFSARYGLSVWQVLFLGTGLLTGIVCTYLWPYTVATCLYWLFFSGFMLSALIRFCASLIPVGRATPVSAPLASNENLPSYSVIVAMYKEARISTQLITALNRLDYPRDRLEVLFALEDDDTETIRAFEQALSGRPELRHMRIIRVPDGTPRTKPRALNHALTHAIGDLTVIYDAEDMPDPQQLLTAARTFAEGPSHLACLQAPLRPLHRNNFISRHFTAEYAVQFEVILPAMHRLGLPFPLGGTSNHFKTDILRRIGAWDAFNVTEDADLGLRLTQYGYTSGLIPTPTYESPPENIRTWIPQRTRWIKGYMQTIGVHTRLHTAFRFKVWPGLALSIGLSVLSALCYAPFTGLILTTALINLLQPDAINLLWPDKCLFIIGIISALTALAIGTRRARAVFTLSDMLTLPAYWSLQSIACLHALWQLIVCPFHWDKTEHAPILAPAETTR
ncbi:MAG: glycosyltransferase family 2 protein [Asticcacaulis sp.]